MAVPAIQFTPVTPVAGGLVHATSLQTPARTVCNRKCDGWKIALKHVDCKGCQMALVWDVRPKRKNGRGRRVRGRTPK